MIDQFLPELTDLNAEVEPIIRSLLKEEKPPLDLAKAIVTLANQFAERGDDHTSQQLKTIADNIVDKVVSKGIEGLTDLT